jgi:hypothetical protein
MVQLGAFKQVSHPNKCLINDYDQIHRDFESFYQMAETNSTHFQEDLVRLTFYTSAFETALSTIRLDIGKSTAGRAGKHHNQTVERFQCRMTGPISITSGGIDYER